MLSHAEPVRLLLPVVADDYGGNVVHGDDGAVEFLAGECGQVKAHGAHILDLATDLVAGLEAEFHLLSLWRSRTVAGLSSRTKQTLSAAMASVAREGEDGEEFHGETRNGLRLSADDEGT